MITPEELQLKIKKKILPLDLEYPIFKFVSSEYREHLRNINLCYAWLAASVKVWKPKRIVELGAAYGASTLALYHNKSEYCKLVSVDNNSKWVFVTSTMVNDQDGLKLVIEDDLKAPKEFPSLFHDIDYLFIDTEHNYEQISKEWEIYKPFLSDKALVVLDDINVGDMNKFWEELKYPKLDISQYHDSGFGFFIFNREDNAK